jgi:hypothetical protein
VDEESDCAETVVMDIASASAPKANIVGFLIGS